MSYDPVPPFRRDFDAARDPYTARNALGIPEPTGGGVPAPASAPYITSSADATLTNERVLTNTATVTWDFATAGQAKATATVDLSAYAPLASPTFTGDPKAPTPATADNDTSIATTAFVKAQGYATTTALGSYVLKAGDTMTGDLLVIPSAGGVDGIKLTGITGQGRISATGSSTNIANYHTTKGTGAHAFYTRDFGKAQLFINDANADRYAVITGADSGAGGQPTITSGGTAGSKLFLPDAIGTTQSAGDSSLAMATTAFVTGALATLYTEGSWTPTITFTTPGDLSVVYSARGGAYIQIGNLVIAWFDLTTSTFTFTTASGNFQITGLPFTVNTTIPPRSVTAIGVYQGITKAGYSHIVTQANNAATTLTVQAAGSGVALAAVTAADTPSGGPIVLRGMTIYRK